MVRTSVRAIGRASLWGFAAVGVVASGLALYAALSWHVATSCPPDTAAQLRLLANALEFYRLDNSRYPTTGQGLQALVEPSLLPPRPASFPAGGYVKSAEFLRDDWGRAFIYEARGDGFVLLSLGADGRRGVVAEIRI